MKTEGFIGVKPEIKKITFTTKGKMGVHLVDGRIVILPLSLFPSINKLDQGQRMNWGIIDSSGFTFEDCDEVYHIEQILGREEDYKYSFV